MFGIFLVAYFSFNAYKWNQVLLIINTDSFSESFIINMIIKCFNFLLECFLKCFFWLCLQLCPFHFIPSGLHVPVTAIYNTRYGEIEERQSMKNSISGKFIFLSWFHEAWEWIWGLNTVSISLYLKISLIIYRWAEKRTAYKARTSLRSAFVANF